MGIYYQTKESHIKYYAIEIFNCEPIQVRYFSELTEEQQKERLTPEFLKRNGTPRGWVFCVDSDGNIKNMALKMPYDDNK